MGLLELFLLSLPWLICVILSYYLIWKVLAGFYKWCKRELKDILKNE